MKKNGKTRGLRALLAALALAVSPAAAAELREADRLFDKGLYQQSLRLYRPLLKSSSGETRWKALYRACEAEALLFRYGKAVERLRKAKLPKDPLWRARFLLLKTELNREFIKQYAHRSRRDVVEGEDEVFHDTPEKLHKEVAVAYWQLWKLRKTLVRRAAMYEGYFLDNDKADWDVFPTLLDFMVHRWTGYVLTEAPEPEGAARPKALSFVRQKYRRRPSPKLPPAELAASVMGESARMKGRDREQARELWRVRRLTLPFDHGGKVGPFKDHAADHKSAAAILAKWMDSFKTPGGRAAAGFRAATLYRGVSMLDRTVELCDKVSKRWGGTLGGKKCRRLNAEIKTPSMSLQGKVVPPSGEKALTLTTRNIKDIHIRLYPVTPRRLRDLYLARGRGHRDWAWSQVLGRADDELMKRFLSSERPLRSWSVPVKHRTIYDYAVTSVDLKDVRPGLYLAITSGDRRFAQGESLIYGTIVNVTDLILVGTAGVEGHDRDLIWRRGGVQSKSLPAFHFYLLNGLTGEAVGGAPISIRHYPRHQSWRDASRRTDPLGRAQFPMRVHLTPNEYSYHHVDPLAERDGRWAYWSHSLSQHFSVPAPFQLFVEADRPIHRPGQNLSYKVTVTERIPRGFKAYTGDSKVTVRVRDVNGVEIHKDVKAVGPNGTIAGKLLIPTGRLLGNYSVEATMRGAGHTWSGYLSFAVEEYKRPEFEVKLEEAEGTWRFGDEAEVKGSVKYYFGGPVPDAPVTYIIHREAYRPWFCWWWSWRPDYGREEILRAETKTDADGKFSFKFVPKPRDRHAADPLPARFTIEVEARDPGGRTLKTSRSYVAGKKAYLFKITPSAGFAKAGEKFRVDTRLLNLNETPVEGEGRVTVHRLEGDPESPERGPQWGGAFPQSPSLERIYRNVPDGAKIHDRAVEFDKKKGAALDLALPEAGAYRLTLIAKDPWGGEVKQSVIVLCVEPKGVKVPLKISSLSLPEHMEYAVGETAVMLIGSAELDRLTHYEVWGGSFLIERRSLTGGGIRVLRLPLTERHKGGTTVRWFGVKDFKPRSGSLTVKVPWREKKLDVKLKYDKVLKPGQKAAWSILAKDARRRKVRGEALAKMYDRSLEYYAKAAAARLESLYSARPAPSGALGSVHAIGAQSIRIEKGWIQAILKAFRERIQEPLPPGLRINRSRLHGRRYDRFGGFRREMLMAKQSSMDFEADGGAFGPAAAAAPVEAEEMLLPGVMKEERKAKKKNGGRQDKGPAEPKAEVRKDFSETAFFKPQLPLRQGRSSFKFSAPERLTSWRISGHVHTADIKVGRFSEEAVTRKELMVRVEMPRFFREGDKGTLKAVVHNESGAELTGALALAVSEEGKSAASKLGMTGLKRTFTIKPHALRAFSWKIAVPSGITTFQVRAIVRAGRHVDAEEREIPILPSRQRLIDSAVVALNGSVMRSITLKALQEDDPSRRSELLQLQVDPQLALTVLNSLPFLVRYPYECVEQTLNRYVPVAVVNAIYKKHPAIAKAAAKLPKRDTLTPAWEKDDPKRLMKLMETPWLGISKGRKSVWPVIDLFDPKVVKANKEDALGKLKAAQLPNGGFPWFPGGRADPYITLYVLAGFSEARHYGVAVPKDVIRNALRYVMNEIPRNLKPKERNVAILLYAAYVVTSFPEELKGRGVPELRKARKLAKAWTDYADKHYRAMTRLGKAYAAYAYRRLGDKKKGDLYLRRAMDAAREDPVAGVYWTPEKYSWLWYNDTLETHAFMLRMLQTLRPKDKRIPGMVQWLIFNRKGTEWKSTKASAAAIFALLDFMRKRGSLDKGDSYTVRWGAIKDAVQVEPYDWMDKPLRWTRTGADITPAYRKPRVIKKGPGLAFASLTYIYTTEKLAEASEAGMLNVSRKFYRRVKQGKKYHLKPLKRGGSVKVGDEIEVRLKVKTRSQFEYVHLKDPRGAGFEAEELRSGWKWDQLGRYEEPRDSLTNFFVSWLPHGEYVLRYRVRPTTPGHYLIGAAVIQSMYSPEFAAHSSGFELVVVGK